MQWGKDDTSEVQIMHDGINSTEKGNDEQKENDVHMDTQNSEMQDSEIRRQRCSSLKNRSHNSSKRGNRQQQVQDEADADWKKGLLSIVRKGKV